MNFSMTITCDCGETTLIPLKKTTHTHEDGRVYEEYTSISDSLEGNVAFEGKVHPEGVFVICKNCKTTHDLST